LLYIDFAFFDCRCFSCRHNFRRYVCFVAAVDDSAIVVTAAITADTAGLVSCKLYMPEEYGKRSAWRFVFSEKVFIPK
jgi:hypothetical protein